MAMSGWSPDDRGVYCWRCGRTIGPSESDDRGCPRCRAEDLPWERLVRLGSFEGLIRDMVHEVKFTRWRRLGHDLGVLVGRAVAGEMARVGVDPSRAIVVPVPMSTWRRLTRGIDHTQTIARGVAQVLGTRVVRAMSRRHRPTQWSVPASRRHANVATSFRSLEGTLPDASLIVLVDDVTTTRSTLRAACNTLRKGPRSQKSSEIGRIWTAVIGVTPEPEHDRRARLDSPDPGFPGDTMKVEKVEMGDA